VAKQVSFRRRITAIIATIGTIVIIAIIATIGIIAHGNARASGHTFDALMHRAGSTGLPVKPAFLFLPSTCPLPPDDLWAST
jgi:hypothetical protein